MGYLNNIQIYLNSKMTDSFKVLSHLRWMLNRTPFNQDKP